jgi:hypothetical protein
MLLAGGQFLAIQNRRVIGTTLTILSKRGIRQVRPLLQFPRVLVDSLFAW